jgi:glycosyltransferase involved in cell wall biosynthesis
MPALINAHDIIIGQFHIGSLGMAELESMACAKPVVCYFNYNDWYPEPPPVFSTNQPEQVVEFLSALVEDPVLRHERGKQGQNWVRKYHGYISVASQLEQIYRG